MRYVLILLGLVIGGVAEAIDCQKLPSCEELGYSKESVKGCADGGYVLCPFDETYKKCVDYDCETLGFTESDKSSWCADLIKCKGNEKMTLCQKPCLATDYNSLKELAESGKCKLLTLKNDITIPLNESLTLAENTVIDGGGYTLHTSGNQKSLNTFIMNNKTGFENLTLKHQHDHELKGSHYIQGHKDTDQISLHNVNLIWNTSVTENEKHHILYLSNYTISGNFDLDVHSQYAITFQFSGGNFSFKDAHMHATLDNRMGIIFRESNVSFDGTTAEISNTGTIFSGNRTTKIKNSTISAQNIEELFSTLFWNTEEINVIIEEGGSLNLTLLRLDTPEKDVVEILELAGTASHPASLTINVSLSNFGKVQIKASNSTDTLILNGVTYRPKQAGTTKLSEVPNSENWAKEE